MGICRLSFFSPNTGNEYESPVKYADPHRFWRVRNLNLTENFELAPRIMYSDITWTQGHLPSDLAVGEFSPDTVGTPNTNGKWRWKDATPEQTVSGGNRFVTSVNVSIPPGTPQDYTLVSKRVGAPLLAFNRNELLTCVGEVSQYLKVEVLAPEASWTVPVKFKIELRDSSGASSSIEETFLTEAAFRGWSKEIKRSDLNPYVDYKLVEFYYTKPGESSYTKGGAEGFVRMFAQPDNLSSISHDDIIACIQGGTTPTYALSVPPPEKGTGHWTVFSGGHGKFSPSNSLM